MYKLRYPAKGGRLLLALVVGGALFGIASAVQAALPDASGVIHGCYALKDGRLRLIDTSAGQSCDSKKEGSISWNHTGPTGAQGPSGPSGTTGLTGSRGPTGPQGPGTTSFVTTVPAGGNTLLETLSTGLTVSGSCGDITVDGHTFGPGADLAIATVGSITVDGHTFRAPLQMSGTGNSDLGGGPPTFPIDQNGSSFSADFAGVGYVDVDVIAREVIACTLRPTLSPTPSASS